MKSMHMQWWRAPLKGRAAAYDQIARVVTLAVLAVTLFTGLFLLPAASEQIQPSLWRIHGLQGARMVHTAFDIPQLHILSLLLLTMKETA
jgi:hypothetical protein